MSRTLFRLLLSSRWVRHLSTRLFRFYSDVFAWYPDGRVEKLSTGIVVHHHSCIHPEGSHVVFHGGSIGTVNRIWRVNLNSNEIKALTPSSFNARHAVYSWDGSHIAFSGDRASGKPPDRIKNFPIPGLTGNMLLNHHIYIMDNEGNHLKQVTQGPYYDQRPTFSPDGKHIAFVSNRSGGTQIWSLALDGGNEPQQILEGWGYRPWYSADGKDIYFFSEVHRLKILIFKIPAGGGQMQPVPFCEDGQNQAPFIDPDGKTMLIHSDRTGTWSIWEIPLKGGKPRKLMPPGFTKVTHPTRSRNGIITFDVVRSELDKMFRSKHK